MFHENISCLPRDESDEEKEPDERGRMCDAKDIYLSVETCVLPDEHICEVEKGQVDSISCEDGEFILDFGKDS